MAGGRCILGWDDLSQAEKLCLVQKSGRGKKKALGGTSRGEGKNIRWQICKSQFFLTSFNSIYFYSFINIYKNCTNIFIPTIRSSHLKKDSQSYFKHTSKYFTSKYKNLRDCETLYKEETWKKGAGIRLWPLGLPMWFLFPEPQGMSAPLTSLWDSALVVCSLHIQGACVHVRVWCQAKLALLFLFQEVAYMDQVACASLWHSLAQSRGFVCMPSRAWFSGV